MNINNKSSLNSDPKYINTRVKASSHLGAYQTENHLDYSPLNTAHSLAMNEPTVLYRDGYGKVSRDTQRTYVDNTQQLTNKNVIQQLEPRLHATVPLMVRGTGNIDTESILRDGINTSEAKPCNLAGVTIDRFAPQISCLKDNPQDPKNILMEDTDRDWVRGGRSSREILRECNKSQYWTNPLK